MMVALNANSTQLQQLLTTQMQDREVHRMDRATAAEKRALDGATAAEGRAKAAEERARAGTTTSALRQTDSTAYFLREEV